MLVQLPFILKIPFGVLSLAGFAELERDAR